MVLGYGSLYIKLTPCDDTNLTSPFNDSTAFTRRMKYRFPEEKKMSRLVGKPTMWFPNRSDTNRPVQLQKQARSLKFWS